MRDSVRLFSKNCPGTGSAIEGKKNTWSSSHLLIDSSVTSLASSCRPAISSELCRIRALLVGWLQLPGCWLPLEVPVSAPGGQVSQLIHPPLVTGPQGPPGPPTRHGAAPAQPIRAALWPGRRAGQWASGRSVPASAPPGWPAGTGKSQSRFERRLRHSFTDIVSSLLITFVAAIRAAPCPPPYSRDILSKGKAE